MTQPVLPVALQFDPILGSGAYLLNGGLQLRGVTTTDSQLSLQRYWTGELCLAKFYSALQATDVPFAQDCFGDQYFERDGITWRLSAESGDVECLERDPKRFIEWVTGDPAESLSLPDDLNLQPGKLLLAWPPFCTTEGNKASIKPIDNDEVIRFHAHLAQQIKALPDGQMIRIKLADDT